VKELPAALFIEEKWQLFIYCNAGRFEYEPEA
jgi:hypothetical protein